MTGGRSWPQMLQEALAAKSGEEVELHSTGFSPVPSNAHEFAERKMREVSPGTVVLLLGTSPFTAGFTWLRVQQLFGKRAGRWYRGIEERFDARTRNDSGAPSRVNSAGRAFVRRVIGTKAHTTREKATENYRNVFRVLSRFEESSVVIMAYPGVGDHARKGKGPELRRLFIADMSAAAAERHFHWVDGAAAFAGQDSEAVKLDDLHFSPLGHRVLAKAVEDALLEVAEAV